jgi:hypothetical protein
MAPAIKKRPGFKANKKKAAGGLLVGFEAE